MSGHKRTTVSLNDIDLVRLEGVETRLRTVEKDYQNIRNRVKETHDSELKEDYQMMAERQAAIQDALDQAITGFSYEINHVEKLNGEILLEQAQEFQAQLSELGSGLYEKTSEIIQANQNEFVNFIENSLHERDHQWNKMREEIFFDKQRAAEYTSQVLDHALNLLTIVSNFLPVDRYHPGLITQIEYELDQAYDNLNQGFVDAGLVSGQQIVREISRLRLDIEGKEMRRKSLLASVRRRLREDVQISEQQKTISAIGLNGEELNIEIDVPFWSGGRYANSLIQLRGLLNQLDEQGESMTEAELVDLQTEKIRGLETSLQEAIYWARKNILASQVRYNIAGCVVQALEEQGFMLSAGCYEAKDQRGAYQVLLKHIDGSEVAVQVSELDGEIGSSLVDLETQNPELRSEHEMRQRAREVASSLANYGLQVGRSRISQLDHYRLPSDHMESSHQVNEKRVQYGRN